MTNLLIPKLTNCFEVSFSSELAASNDIDISVLSEHVTAFDLGTEVFIATKPVHQTNHVIAWLADYEACTLMTTVRALQKHIVNDIIIEVTLLSEAGIPLEKFTYYNAAIRGLQHSILSRETGTVATICLNEGTMTEQYGTLTKPTTTPTVTKLMQFSFTIYEHTTL